MIRALFLTLLFGAFGASGAVADPDLRIEWQLRWPAREELPSALRTLFVSDSSLSSGPVQREWVKSEGDYALYTWSGSARFHRQRILILKLGGDTVARVFRVDLPAMPRCTAWSDWQAPTFTEDADDRLAHRLLAGGAQSATLSPTPPAFELRYRIGSRTKRC